MSCKGTGAGRSPDVVLRVVCLVAHADLASSNFSRGGCGCGLGGVLMVTASETEEDCGLAVEGEAGGDNGCSDGEERLREACEAEAMASKLSERRCRLLHQRRAASIVAHIVLLEKWHQ